MAIQFRCPACGQKMSIASRMAGRDVSCPTCSMSVTVPFEEVDQENPFVDEVPDPASQRITGSQLSQQTEESSIAEGDTDEKQKVRRKRDDEEPEFTIRKPSTDFEELDLTPMVDVTFLLLIFFMITASFSTQKSIAIPPPEPDQQGAQQTPDMEELEQNSIFVEIDAENRIFVEDEEVASLPEIPRKLADLRNESDRNEIVIMPDDLARHEIVVEVIDAANEVQMQRIRIASRKQDN